MKGLVDSREIQNEKDCPFPGAGRGSEGIRPRGGRPVSFSRKGRGAKARAVAGGAVLLFIFMAALGAGSMKEKKDEVELSGKVYLMGNEPFPQVALKGDDGIVYALKGEHEKELRGLQGKRLSVKGAPGREKVRGAASVEVKSYRVLE